MKVVVVNGNVDAAMKKLRNSIAQDGTLRHLKSKEFYLKPSARKREYKKQLEANWRKKQRKLAKRGY